MHRTTDAFKEFAFDNGTEVDGSQLTYDLYLRRYEEFGLLDETLHHLVASADDADEFDVAVWPYLPLPGLYEIVLNSLRGAMAIAHAPQAHRLGFAGRGVRFAVYGRGPRTLRDLAFADRLLLSPI